MADRLLPNRQKIPPNSIMYAEFEVTERDLLKIRVNAIDEIMPNEKAIVCQFKFIDQKNSVIEAPVQGAFVSPRFGDYIYIRSRSAGEAILWAPEVIHAPIGASTLQVTIYPWQSSPELRICEEIECLDYRRVGTDRKATAVEPAGVCSGQYELLPFWRAAYTFETLKKATGKVENVEVLISFANAEGNAVECQESVLESLVGGVSKQNRTTFLITPSTEESEYKGFYRSTACLQLLPPPEATSFRALLRVGSQDSRTLVSQNFWAFEFLMENQLTPESVKFLSQCESLPTDLRKYSFNKLLAKFPANSTVYAAALDFFLEHNHTQDIVRIANQILNRFNDVELVKSAQRSLAICSTLDIGWLPSTGKIVTPRTEATSSASPVRVAHLLYLDDIENATEDPIQSISVLTLQKQSGSVSPFVITPDFEPPQNTQNSVWCIGDENHIKRYGLNSLSSDEASTVLPTTLLNFCTVIAKQILVDEGATIIHAHDSYREYNFVLMALALSKALRIPMVYEHRQLVSSVSEDNDEFSGGSDLRRLQQDFRCMREAHALILPENTQLAHLSENGIVDKKIFFLPQLPTMHTVTETERDRYLTKVNDIYLQAYKYAKCSAQQIY